MTEKMTLAQIEVQKANILDVIDQAGGEITPEIENLLALVELKEVEKIDGYQRLIKSMKATSKELKDEGERYISAARGCKTFVDRLRERIRFVMQETEQTEVLGSSIRFKLCKPGKAKLEINGELPDNYRMAVTTYEPDKERIRTDLENGVEIKGARLVSTPILRDYINNKKGTK